MHILLHSSGESAQALDLNKLTNKYITFFTLSLDDKFAGCGAFKKLNNEHSETKSMRTQMKLLRQGVATVLLAHIVDYAQSYGVKATEF